MNSFTGARNNASELGVLTPTDSAENQKTGAVNR
jgi:hypothetical protein